MRYTISSGDALMSLCFMNSSMKMLCLAGALTVLVEPVSASNRSVANVEKLPYGGIKGFEHFMITKSWQAKASEEMEDPYNPEKFIAKGYKEGFYHDSILNVISKAIADCFQKINEFEKFWDTHQPEIDQVKQKTRKGNEYLVEWEYFSNHFVIFDTSPKAVNYTRANWNAFVLYNYLNYRLNYKGELVGLNEQQDKTTWIIEQIVSNATRGYIANFVPPEQRKSAVKLIELAGQDIKRYVKGLGLDDYLADLEKSRNDKDAGQFMPPRVLIPVGGKYHKISGGIGQVERYCGKFIVTRTDTKTQMDSPDIHTMYVVDNGKASLETIDQDVYQRYSDDFYAEREKEENEIINDNKKLYKMRIPKSNEGESKWETMEEYKKNNKNSKSRVNQLINQNTSNNMNNKAQNVGTNTNNNLRRYPQVNQNFAQNNNRRNMNSRGFNQWQNMGMNNQNNNRNLITQNNFPQTSQNVWMNNGRPQNAVGGMNNFQAQNVGMNNQSNNRNFGPTQNNFFQNPQQNIGMGMNSFQSQNRGGMAQGNMNSFQSRQMQQQFVPNNNMQNANFGNNRNNMWMNQNNNFRQNPPQNMPMSMNNFVNMNMPNQMTMKRATNIGTPRWWVGVSRQMKALTSINAVPTLRNMNEIHNLTHSFYNEDGTIQTTVNKCYFNSTMQCLANLNLIYSAVQQSFNNQPKNKTPDAHLISAMFKFLTACRDGSMAYTLSQAPNVSLQAAMKYDEAVRELYDALMNYQVIFDARVYDSVDIENKNGVAKPWSELYKAALNNFKNTVNPARDHLLNDFYVQVDKRQDGYSAVTFILDILYPLQEQMANCGVQPPTGATYGIPLQIQPMDESSFSNADQRNKSLGIALGHERYGRIMMPHNIKSLPDFNNTYFNSLKNSGISVKQLPQVLVYAYEGSKITGLEKLQLNDMNLPKIIYLQDEQGRKTYRLNSFVSGVVSTAGHYKPVMLTNQGFSTINDVSRDVTASNAQELYNSTTEMAKAPTVIFYEQIS